MTLSVASLVRSSGGLTLVEALVASLLVLIAAMGLFQAFGYGRAYVEKMGLRRQALAVLQEEMEYWRKQRREIGSSEPLSYTPDHAGIRKIILNEEKGIDATVSTHISRVLEDRELRYQQISSLVYYKGKLDADSIALTTCMYLH